MHFDAPESLERQHADVETACFRTAQEALRNIAQHANATQVWVKLLEADGALQLSVRDNGIGFDAVACGAVTEQARFGLHAMAERIRQAGGRVDVRSRAGHGTEVRARIPQTKVAKNVAASPAMPPLMPLGRMA